MIIEPDNLASEHDVKPVLGAWEKFKWELTRSVTLEMKVTLLTTSFISALMMTWCVANNNPLGLGVSLLMTIGTLWVSDSNDDPYS